MTATAAAWVPIGPLAVRIVWAEDAAMIVCPCGRDHILSEGQPEPCDCGREYRYSCVVMVRDRNEKDV